MKTFYVKMPFSGYVGLEVECEDESGGQDAFYEAYEKTKGLLDPNIEMDFELTDYLIRGNVSGVMLNEMEVEEIAD